MHDLVVKNAWQLKNGLIIQHNFKPKGEIQNTSV